MRWRIYLALVLLALVLTFVLQNTEVVNFKLFFWTFGLPRALMFLVVFLSGVVTGLLMVASHRSSVHLPAEQNRSSSNKVA